MTLNNLIIKLQHIKETKEGGALSKIIISDPNGYEYQIDDIQFDSQEGLTIIAIDEGSCN
jgi:hypothetical protein